MAGSISFMLTTFQIRNRTYTLDEVETIVVRYEHAMDLAESTLKDNNIEVKAGSTALITALYNYHKGIKPAVRKPTTNLGTTIYLRYNEDDSYVYLATKFCKGVPLANHALVGGSTIVQTSNSPTGPWLSGSFYAS